MNISIKNQVNENKLLLTNLALLLILGGILFFFSFDRQIVSILKTTLMEELDVSNQNYSMLITAFMVPYTFMYFVSGIIVDKYGSRYVLTTSVIFMSIATLTTGLSHSMTGLVIGRIILGLAESCIVPALTLAIFTWFKPHQRASAYQTTNLIQSFGLILAPPFVAWMTVMASWRIAFFVPAIIGCFIALLWFIKSKKAPNDVNESDDNNVNQIVEEQHSVLERYKAVLTSKPIWVLIIARLLTDPFWFFYQYWQVGFMQESLGLTLAEVGKLLWFPPLIAVIGVFIMCYFSDKLVSKGLDATKARLVIICSCTVLSVFTFILPSVSNPYIAVAIMTSINFMCTTWLTMASIMMGGIAHKYVIATAIGLMSALGGVSSIIFNGFVGSIIDSFGYSVPIYFGAALHPIGAIVLACFFFRKKNYTLN